MLSVLTCKLLALITRLEVFIFFRESEWEKCCGVVAAPEGSFIYGKKKFLKWPPKNRFDEQKWFFFANFCYKLLNWKFSFFFVKVSGRNVVEWWQHPRGHSSTGKKSSWNDRQKIGLTCKNGHWGKAILTWNMWEYFPQLLQEVISTGCPMNDALSCLLCIW